MTRHTRDAPLHSTPHQTLARCQCPTCMSSTLPANYLPSYLSTLSVSLPPVSSPFPLSSSTMDFAPYQSESPEASRSFNRPLSPPVRASSRSYSPLPASLPPPILPTHVAGSGGGYRPSGWGASDRETVNQFETSLPIRYVPCWSSSRGGREGAD